MDGLPRHHQQRHAADRAGRPGPPAAAEPGAQGEPLAEAGGDGREPEHDGGRDGGARPVDRAEERRLEGTGRGRGGQQGGPGPPGQRQERAAVRHEHEDGEDEPAREDPGAADGDRAGGRPGQHLRRPDRPPEHTGGEHQQRTR
nr:hypothetical protein [Actinomadura mexicana]